FPQPRRMSRFGVGPAAPSLIGSADRRERSLARRVEVLAPVRDPALQARLDEILEVLLADDSLAWRLNGDGVWRPPPSAGGVNSQTRLEEAARARARPVAAVWTRHGVGQAPHAD